MSEYFKEYEQDFKDIMKQLNIIAFSDECEESVLENIDSDFDKAKKWIAQMEMEMKFNPPNNKQYLEQILNGYK